MPIDSPAPRRDLIGTRWFWAAALLTLLLLLLALAAREARVWIALGVLVMWTAFSVVNAIASRRLHSIVSAPVYFGALCLVAASAAGRLDIEVWMVWLLGGGVIAANLSERVFSKYL